MEKTKITKPKFKLMNELGSKIKHFALLLMLYSIATTSYSQITFSNGLNAICIDKNYENIAYGDTVKLLKMRYDDWTGFVLYDLFNKKNRKTISIEEPQLKYFAFTKASNINDLWELRCLQYGIYRNLLKNGYQYSLRNDMELNSIDYTNALINSGRVFNDDYFEDYLYQLTNKIHSSSLNNNRPGNIQIKVIYDIKPNALCLPNGTICITTGLLTAIQSESELVAIIAHEIAHFELDHNIVSYNLEADRKKRAESWALFATVLAAGIDISSSIKGKNPLPGVLTYSTAVLASAISNEVLKNLGLKFSREQEIQADKSSKEILRILGYDTLALSSALSRIKAYNVSTGNYMDLSESGTHPDIDERVKTLGTIDEKNHFVDISYLKKVSNITTYNASVELWSFGHLNASLELVNRNINTGVACETDYLISAIIKRRMSDSEDSNIEVIQLLEKAKSLNVNYTSTIYKELGITYLRLSYKAEAKSNFTLYLTKLIEIRDRNEIKEIKNSNQILADEIEWTQRMIFKVDKL